MTSERELVLAVAKEIVFNQRGSFLDLIRKDNINWQRFKEILTYHGLTPFAYLNLKEYQSFCPQDLIQTLRATYYYTLFHNFNLQQKFLELYSVFEEEDVSLIPIKGVALLEDLYAKSPIRPSTDIDVLVKEEDLDKAIKILENLGYKKNLEGLKEEYWRKKQYHFVFIPLQTVPPKGRTIDTSDALALTEQAKEELRNRSPILELHWDLDYRRYRRRLLPKMFNRLREFIIGDKKVEFLSPEDTFFALALHQRRFGVALSLRGVCDMAALLNKYKSIFDWDYVLNESRKSELCSTIYFALCQVNLFFGIDTSEYIWKELNMANWKKKIIQRFIEKNTFLPQQSSQGKNLYLKAHFLLYDNFWEPIDYILNIPQEQFAKYYGLVAYDKKTEFFYRNKLLYIPFRAISDSVLKRDFKERW